VSFGGKQKELVANNLTVPPHDHAILKTLKIMHVSMLFLTICRDVPKTPEQNSFLNAKGGQ